MTIVHEFVYMPVYTLCELNEKLCCVLNNEIHKTCLHPCHTVLVYI